MRSRLTRRKKREEPRVGSSTCRGPPRPGEDWCSSRGRARCGRYLKGSFTTTLTPAMTPVTALRTCWTACWLISPAPLMAPVAAAEAASSTLRPTCLAPEMAPSTAFLATVPTSPPTSAALLTRVRALTLTVSIVSAPTSFVPLRTPTTPPLAAAPTSPPTWAVPMMAPRRTSDTVDVNAVPTAPVPLMVVTSVPLTVSTAAFRTSPVPLIEPTILSFTDSMMPLFIRDLLPGDELWSLSGDGPTHRSLTPAKQNAIPTVARAKPQVSHCAMSAAELTNHQRQNAQGLSRGNRGSTRVPRPSRPTSPSPAPSGSRRCSPGTRRRARFAKGLRDVVQERLELVREIDVVNDHVVVAGLLDGAVEVWLPQAKPIAKRPLKLVIADHVAGRWNAGGGVGCEADLVCPGFRLRLMVEPMNAQRAFHVIHAHGVPPCLPFPTIAGGCQGMMLRLAERLGLS